MSDAAIAFPWEVVREFGLKLPAETLGWSQRTFSVPLVRSTIRSSNARLSPDLHSAAACVHWSGRWGCGSSCGSVGVQLLQSAQSCLQPHLQHQRRIRGPTTGIRGDKELSKAVANTWEISLGFVSLVLSALVREGRGNRILLFPLAICHEAGGGGCLNAINPSPNPPPTGERVVRSACLSEPAHRPPVTPPRHNYH